MNTKSRIITGSILFLGGIVLMFIAIFNSFSQGWFVCFIYGLPLFIIGIFIFLNKNEDKIERRKDMK